MVHLSSAMEVDGAPTSAATTDSPMDEEITTLRNADQVPPPPRPIHRRGSMSHDEERQRRASIKAILSDESIPIQERRKSIQSLMDGRRSSIGTASVASTASTTNVDDNPYGYGEPEAAYRERPGESSNNDFPGEIASVLVGDAVVCCEPVSNEMTMRAEQTRPPCPHYDRKCTLVAPCCGAAFGCRICHDDSPILPPLLIQKRAMGRYARSSSMPMNPSGMQPQTPEETHHNIDRFAVKEVICRECYTKQSSKT